MKQVNLEKILKDKKAPIDKYPKPVLNIGLYFIKKVFHLKKINEFISIYGDTKGIEFIKQVFSYINFQIKSNKKPEEFLPEKSGLIIVANHPLGALDGLGLINLIHSYRKDVKIVVNDILSNIDNLEEFFLPVDLYGTKSQKQNLLDITKAIKEEKIVVFFPAAKVSRLIDNKIKDEKWNKGAISFARKFNKPILPIFVDSRNTYLFYFAIKIKDFFAPFLLPREMFKKQNKILKFKIGKTIPPSIFDSINDDQKLTDLFKKAVYNIDDMPKELMAHKQTD